MNTGISIAISFYNTADYLDFSIKSVLNQTFTDWELILVDDGSTDSSLSIARYYEMNDSRIKVFSDGQNKGVPVRLNEISRIAKYPIIARMDADDIMCPTRIEQQFLFLLNNPDIDLVASRCITIDSRNKVYGIKGKEGIIGKDEMIYTNPIMNPSIMGRTSWFMQNPYNEKMVRAEDYELFVRTLFSTTPPTIYVLPDLLMFYRDLGLPYLNKYLKTSVGMREIYHDLKCNRHLPLFLIYVLYIRSYLKDFMYIIIFKLKWDDFFFTKKHVTLSNSEKIEYQALLNKSVL
ncbi:MAG: glycosyltransferase family 2 protein [Prevotellaceae bacterium]|jgi:glycosyltransferase involved in cell wall biosynthesis|nr:glycosyltransferase family 2 protein [Prevotellaceae bacterium]